MLSNSATKTAVSVTEMAAMMGLSRARLYQLIRKNKLPTPDIEEGSKRPFFNEEKQRQCLEVRRRNCGIDGKPIMFYSRRRDVGVSRKKVERAKPAVSPHADLIDQLGVMGITATAAQVDAVVKELFPTGTTGVPQEELFRAVFLRIRSQNSAGNDRR
jgi:phage antirepressor YoqD-like protein